MMRNPNGYGSVVKLSGNRRNPYVARKTKGFDDRGYPIYITVGYYPTREAGMIALAEYNQNPYDVDAAKVTFAELYAKWLEKKAPKLSKSLRSALQASFEHTKSIHQMRYKDIKSFHMQDCIDHCGYGYSTQGAIKNLFGHMDQFAMELDVIQKMYSSLTTSTPVPESSKVPFSNEEVQLLWDMQHLEWVDTVLILLFTGWRISEFLQLKSQDVDMNLGVMKGGIKTKNGKDRIVPIHSKILPFIQRWFNRGTEYLFTNQHGGQLSDNAYRRKFLHVMQELHLNHCPHECRHTLRSRLDSAGANKRCIDLIMGHKSKDVGERVYTHKTIDELKTAIELVTH